MIYQGDCMVEMAKMPDRAYDLAICDIPYGIESAISKGGGSHTKASVKFHQLYSENGKAWDKAVTPEYFQELQRVSANQIIFGANYYNMPACRCFVIWDKDQPVKNFSQIEYAWTSFNSPPLIFKFCSRGGFTLSAQDAKIHPTQKPVKLYEFLLKNYANPGERILDTHLGSGSSAIACDIMGYDFTGYEIDADYYKAATERLERHQQQEVMTFDHPSVPRQLEAAL